MDKNKLNIRYAQALLDLALERNSLDLVYDEMKAIYHLCKESKELANVLKSPIIKGSKKVQIVQEIFSSKFSELTTQYLLFLVYKKREVNLKNIARAFLELYKDKNNIETAYLYTADSDSSERVSEAIIPVLETFTGKTVEKETVISPQMIGGFRLVFGDSLYDASISTQLNKLKKEFSENEYKKKA